MRYYRPQRRRKPLEPHGPRLGITNPRTCSFVANSGAGFLPNNAPLFRCLLVRSEGRELGREGVISVPAL